LPGSADTYGARHAAKQRRHFGTGLREAEDVVDEDEHVRVLDVAEILGDGEPAKPYAKTRSRRLVHLAVNQGAGVDDPRLLHLEVKIVALASALANTAEHGFSTVPLGDVVDQLLDDDGLADAGAPEESDLTALHEWGDQVDDLDAGLEDLGLRLEVRELRSRTMDRPALDARWNRRTVVDGIAQHVEDSAQRSLANRNRDRTTCILDVHSANNSVRR